jgi:transcriptional regulator with XRE-family HTH domain
MLKKWSQRQLAALCNRSQNAIHLLETGQSDTIGEEFAMALTRELGLTLDKVFVDIPVHLLPTNANCGATAVRESA